MGDLLEVHALPKPRQFAELTPEAQNFKAYKRCWKSQEASSIVALAFSPQSPHHLAVVNGTKVSLWKQGKDKGYEHDGNISKFKDLTQCAAWRGDGRLLLAGEASGTCAVIDESRKVLRRFHGHKDAVTCANFGAVDKTRAATGGRDGRLHLWDVATSELIHGIDGHSDCLKVIASGLRGPDTWISAGYDGHIKLWDLRAAQGSGAGAGACVMDINVGHPVEDAAVFPGGAMYVSAGGHGVKMWDLASGGHLVQEMADAHSKTVKAVCLDSMSSVMLTASLDGFAKIYHAADLKHLWTYKLASPALCAAWRPDDLAFAVGLDNGEWQVRQRNTIEDQKIEAKVVAQRAQPKKSFAKRLGHLRGADCKPDSDDERVESIRPAKRQKQLDFFLRKFEYRKSIEYMVNNALTADLGFAVLDELLQQGALSGALSELGEELCTATLRWLNKAFTTVDSLQLHLFLEALHTLFDFNKCLQPPSTPELIKECKNIDSKLAQEMVIQEKCIQTRGMLKTVLTL